MQKKRRISRERDPSLFSAHSVPDGQVHSVPGEQVYGVPGEQVYGVPGPDSMPGPEIKKRPPTAVFFLHS